MANINFVPDDYIQKKDSIRAYWMYLLLCFLLVGAMAGSFTIIKVRENAIHKEAYAVAEQLKKAQEEIAQFEKLQFKRRQMMQTALTAVELIEAVPRSFVLATLTNSLPSGTSLSRIKLSESDRSLYGSYKSTAAKTVNNQTAAKSQALPVALEIEGFAPSDHEVADYIANLNHSLLFDRVDLAYTQEFQKEKNSTAVYRKFKLYAAMKGDAHITKQDIEKVMAWKF
jgi:Tfp pilus assembly protein PilN